MLPLNYNFRPGWMTRAFTPVKLWHSYLPVPETLERYSEETERGERLTMFFTLSQEKK